MPSKGNVQAPDSTRRRIQDVLGQARAALRTSQQFRGGKDDKSTANNNLSSRLLFQQQAQEPDNWSAIAEPQVLNPNRSSSAGGGESNRNNLASRSARNKSQKKYEGDFGPFRESVRSPPTKPKRGGANNWKKKGSQKKTSTVDEDHDTRSKSISEEQQSQRLATRGKSSAPSHVSSSSMSISMNTSDLMVSDYEDRTGGSSSYSSDTDTDAHSMSTLKRVPPRRKNKEVKMKIASMEKLTPLESSAAVTPSRAVADFSEGDADYEDEEVLVERKTTTAPRITAPPPPSIITTEKSSSTGGPPLGLKKGDEFNSFGRALRMKQEPGEDPHWFEKALLIRGETISEAAYKAFKQIYADKEAQAEKLKESKKKPIFTNVTDPEYTADWISDVGSTVLESLPVRSLASDDEIALPVSEFVDGDETIDEVIVDDEEAEEIEDLVNTDSMIRTATELEASGVLSEIAENLQEVLEISEEPESQDFSGMTPEEKTFAKEYEEAMLDKNEPLQSIFVRPKEEEEEEDTRHETESKISEKSNYTEIDDNDNFKNDDDYENTFIQSTNTVTKSSKSSKLLASKSSGASSSKKLSSKSKTMKGSSSEATGKSKSVAGKTTSLSKSNKVVATSTTSSFRRRGSLPPEHALDPPTTRHQKNIQTILEREVYEKEVKRIRSEKLKEERDAQRLRKLAKESLEKNKSVTYSEPDYTEILLPELFKYKSVSGLQAAKAKRATASGTGPPMINYGAPYFSMTGALSGNDYGVTSMAAQVDSLDIPELVREVLASNERMYRLTVEASEQMAKNYKDRVRRKSTKLNDINNNRRK